jgi:hypothetical protein
VLFLSYWQDIFIVFGKSSRTGKGIQVIIGAIHQVVDLLDINIFSLGQAGLQVKDIKFLNRATSFERITNGLAALRHEHIERFYSLASVKTLGAYAGSVKSTMRLLFVFDMPLPNPAATLSRKTTLLAPFLL